MLCFLRAATAAGVLMLAVVPAFAQMPELHEWSTKDGFSAKAAFGSIDDEKQSVTLLIPKAIPLDRLTTESAELAKRLSEQGASTFPPAETESTEGGDPEFVLSVDIARIPTVADWKAASDPEKVAMAGSWIFSVVRHGYASEKLLELVQTARDMNPLALELYAGVELLLLKFQDDKPELEIDELQVHQFANTLMGTMGWLKSGANEKLE